MATELKLSNPMKLMSVTVTLALALAGGTGAGRLRAQSGPPEEVPTFKSSVDLVRVAAIVRDHKGRFVQDLTVRDFEVLDGGERRPIAEFSRDSSGVSIALLFDVSGSMEGKLPNAREAAVHLLSWLDPARDEAAIFSFSSRLEEVVPFTEGLKALPPSMDSMVPFGETSLHDAIAQTARRAGAREGRHRAVVVLTDGNDNASRLTPAEVSGIASQIDVPVYLFGIVPLIDNPASELSTMSVSGSALAGPLADLAARTGGHVFTASSPGQRSAAARQIVEEMRHQYLIAFESSGNPGWHQLVVRARQKDLTVRTRNSYTAGQSHPSL